MVQKIQSIEKEIHLITMSSHMGDTNLICLLDFANLKSLEESCFPSTVKPKKLEDVFWAKRGPTVEVPCI